MGNGEPQINQMYQISKSAMRKFNRLLIDKGMCLTKKQLTALDGVDIRECVPGYQTLKPLSMGEGTALPEYGKLRLMVVRAATRCSVEQTNRRIFLFIPCFEEGYYRYNANRYLYFKIEDMCLDGSRDPDSDYVAITIRDYYLAYWGWSAGVQATVGIKCKRNRQPDEDGLTGVKVSDQILYENLYKSVTQDDLIKAGFTTDELACWKISAETGIEQEHQMGEVKTNAGYKCHREVEGIIEMLFAFTAYTNMMLMSNKPSRGKSSGVGVKRKVKTVSEAGDQQPKKLVRDINTGRGTLSILSEKAPQAPDMEYVRHYKVAAWKTRSHVRTYKSGKQVFVKESVHHRKGFEEGKPAPANLIRMHGKKNET